MSDPAGIQPRNEGPARSTVTKALLWCGIIASVLYIATDMFAATLWEGYSYTAQQVSELSAIGAPTRPLWIVM